MTKFNPTVTLVSVVMPSMNQRAFIEAAVESVLSQDYGNLELIVADGGSSDGTLDWLEEKQRSDSRLRWFSGPDSGPANALNKALSQVRGTIVGWLNSDDLYTPGAMTRAVTAFAAHPEWLMVYGQGRHIDENDQWLSQYPTLPPETPVQQFVDGCFICQPTVFFQRSMFVVLGKLDENLQTAFDFDYWLRAFKTFPGRIGFVDADQACSRLHASCITLKMRRKVMIEGMQVVARHLGKAPAHWVLSYFEELLAGNSCMEPNFSIVDHMNDFISDASAYLQKNDIDKVKKICIEKFCNTNPSEPGADITNIKTNTFSLNGLTNEEIIWCYKNLLHRPPESDAVIESHKAKNNFYELLYYFVNSKEFITKYKIKESSESTGRIFLPVDLKPNIVEYSAGKAQYDKIVERIRGAWSSLGETKAHFSVLTNIQYLPENLSSSIDKFWKSGEVESDAAVRVLSNYGFSDLENKVCVEYGCGVGRVTMGFSHNFKHVHAYDISKAHLNYANERKDEIKSSNIEFHLFDNIFSELMKCDFFYSKIVFQHNPPPIIYLIIRNALRSLNKNGIAIFQVPTYIMDYKFILNDWLNSPHYMDMEMHCLPMELIFKIIDEEGCITLNVREDNMTGDHEKFISNTFVIRKN